jgi:membrane fusion protein, multidrug efflux system
MTAHAEHPPLREPGRVSPRARKAVLASVVVLLIVSTLAVVALHLRRRGLASRQRRTLEAARALGPRLSVARVRTTPTQRTITLPGDVRAFDQSTRYAKVSGYVREVLVQRGQRVKRGQVLAAIESPETQRDVATAAHDAAIARINARRANRLEPSGVVTAQDRDNAVAQELVAQSTLARARDVFDYTLVRAPFDGIVTARYVDPGALLPAATGGTSGALPIVDVANPDRLRVFVYVGQDAASFVKEGDQATVWQYERPDRRIEASVTYTAGALDPRTRTMQVEIDVDNRPWGMLPGTFARVELQVAEPPVPLLPDEALIIRDGRTMAAVVEAGRVRYVRVELGYNDGSTVRVLRGLSGGEAVGLDVPVGLQDGDAVQEVPLAGAQTDVPDGN